MTAGSYAGGTFGFPFGLGGGLYIDNHGRIYPQVYGGTPRWSFSGGYTPNLEGLLTGPSVSGSPGVGYIRPNIGGNTDTWGAGIGTPGVGVTHGFGPLEMSNDYSRPWAAPSIRDSAARAGVPSRYNVFEYGYPDSGTDSSVGDAPASKPNQEASPETPAFAPDAVYSPMGEFYGNVPRSGEADDTPVRYLGRRNGSEARASALDANAPVAIAPGSPPRSLSLNDAYLEFQRHLNADRSQRLPINTGAPPLVPSDDANFSGGLPERLAALMGIDPRNPDQFARPPQDDELSAFYRDDPAQPWSLPRRR